MVDLDFVVQLSDLCSKILTTKLFSKPHGNTILTNHLKLYTFFSKIVIPSIFPWEIFCDMIFIIL
jgi:hypothetical protein